MRKLRNLLAALVVSAVAWMPLTNSAEAQVVIYHHGHPVRVAKAAKTEWSSMKTGVRKGANTVSTDSKKEWSNIKSGTYRMTHRTQATNTQTTVTAPQQRLNNRIAYRSGMSRSQLARTRREAQYRARMERQR